MPATPVSALTWPDYAVLAGSLGLLLYIGFRLTGEQHDTVDFFLARRRVPWWAACLSFLGSLAASFVTDIYRPLLVRGRSERHYLRVSRIAVLLFGVVLGVLAWGFAFVPGQMLWTVFKIAGVTSGSLLGVFLLGLLTRRRVADGANVTAMVAMALVNLVLLLLIETKRLALGWSWLVIVGTAGTMILALLLSLPIGVLRAARLLRTADR